MSDEVISNYLFSIGCSITSYSDAVDQEVEDVIYEFRKSLLALLQSKSKYNQNQETCATNCTLEHKHTKFRKGTVNTTLN